MGKDFRRTQMKNHHSGGICRENREQKRKKYTPKPRGKENRFRPDRERPACKQISGKKFLPARFRGRPREKPTTKVALISSKLAYRGPLFDVYTDQVRRNREE